MEDEIRGAAHSTVDAESIRLITHEYDPETGEIISEAKAPRMQSRGVASQDVMAELQGVDPIPGVQEARWLKEYRVLVTSGQPSSGLDTKIQDLKAKILGHFGANHPAWLECQRLERLQQMKSRLGKMSSASTSTD